MKSKMQVFGAWFCLSMGSAVTLAANATWRSCAEMPTARLGASAGIGVVGGAITVIGSHDGNPGTGRHNEAYNAASNVWTVHTDYPRAEGRLALNENAVVGDWIYLFGGNNIWNNYSVQTVDRYNPVTDTWELDVATLPEANGGVCTVVLGQSIYCFGGRSYSAAPYDKAYAFSTTSHTFAARSPLPTPRTNSKGFVHSGRIWICGGWSPTNSTLPVIEIYDPASDTYEAGPALPEAGARLAWAGVLDDHRIYAVFDKEAKPLVYRYLVSGQWEVLPQTTTTQGSDGGFGVAAVGNSLYVFGGGDFPKSATVQALDIPSLREGLVGYWPFDESPIDQSGLDRGGTPSGGVFWEDGRDGLGKCYRFDGTGKISAGEPSGAAGSTNLTLSVWIKPESTAAKMTILRRRGDWADHAISIEDGVFCFGIMRLGTPPYGSSVLSSQSYRPGVWQHIAMVWDAGTGQAHVYIDGAIDSTHVLQGAVDWANFIEFCIGNKQDDSTHVNFSGCIDDLRIYNRPLSASEIAQLAQTSSHEHTLVVESAYGTPAPPAGTHEFAYGSTVNASVDDSVSIATNARAVCTGWEGTGSVPASGTTNALSFAITNNSSITWQWRTEYRLDLTAGLGGTATGGGWYEAGTDVGIGAVSGEGYAFSHWSDGDTNAQRTVSMPADGLALTAHFMPVADLGRGLVAYYPFDGDGLDHSGTGNDGSWNGGSYAVGRIGSGYHFTAGQYFTVPPDPSLDILTNVTLAAWFRMEGIQDNEYLIGKGEDGAGQSFYAIMLLPEDGISAHFQNSEGVAIGGYTNGVTQAMGAWRHFACVYDGSTIRSYVDGAPVFVRSGVGGFFDTGASEPFFINRHTWWDTGNSSRLSGTIDDVRVYNRALSALEVLMLAQSAATNNMPQLVIATPYGSPVPGVGTNLVERGTAVDASVEYVVPLAANTRARCTGWVGSGSVPVSGATNAVSFVIEGDSELAWQWLTEHRLELTAGLGGTATGGGWYEAGTDVGIGAVSGEGYAFSHWSDGDTNAQRTVSMPAGGLALSAHFAPLAGESIEQVVFNLNGDVWMMNTDGTNLRQVTHVGGIVGSTRLSDNGVLVYCAAAQLWVADADGTDARTIPNITNPAYDFALSPDGSQVAFGEGPSTHFSTYAIRVDGTGRRTVRSTGNYHQMPHGWGMDGFIYFVECIYGNPYTQHVLRIPQEGGTPTSLVGYFSQTPAVSAQGGKVLFLYNQPAPKLRVMNADGSGQTDVPNTPQGVGQSPAIGADGSKVFYVYNGNIWRVGADGTDPRQLTTVGGISSGLDIGFLLTQTPKVNLTVDSAHGSPSPAAGMSLHLYGSLVNAMVQSVVAVGSYERRACVGWTGSGSVPSAGISNQVSFALEESSSLTWLWETQYRVEVQADGNGSVTGSGWYPESYNVELRAIPTAGHRLVEWSDGDTNAVRTVVVSAGGAVFTARFEPIPAGGGLWLDCANLPVGRVAGWAACVPALGRIYVIGSHDGESDPVGSGTRNDRYDPATDTWTPMARYPRGEGRGGIQGAAAHGGDIYFFGGVNNWNAYTVSTVDRYSVTSNVWTTGVATYPLSAGDIRAVSFGGVIYCFGGSHYGGPFYANTYRFDPVSRSFAARAAMPQPRSGMSAFVWENKIWLCGGRGSSGRLDDIVIYDPASDAWSQCPAIPMAALGATFLTYAGFAGDGHLYFVFGDVPDSDPSCKPLVFRYEPNSDTWTPMAPAPHGDGDGGAVAIGNRIYSIGGDYYRHTGAFSAAVQCLELGTLADVKLEVVSAYGSPTPPAGTNTLVFGAPVAASVEQAVELSSHHRVRCTGWTGTGDVPAEGAGTMVSFDLTVPSALTWLWHDEYRVELLVAGNGVVAGAGWFTNGEAVVVSATPSPGSRFVQWSDGNPDAVRTVIVPDTGMVLTASFEVLPAGTIRFKTSQYVGSEVLDDYGVVGLTVQRVDGSLGAASVSFSIVAGSATENVDYIPWAAGGELHWVDGDAAIKRIYIDIPDDLDYEGTEEFQVVLSNATGAVLGSPAVATVSILDNEPAPSRILKLVDELSFGNVVVGTTQTVALAVVNVGNATLNVGGIVLPAGFDVSASNFTVAPGCTQFVDVAFAPDAIGAFGGELSIQSDATADVPVLPISGVGIAPTPEDPDSAVRSIVNLTASIDIKVPDEATFLAVEDALEPGLFVVAMSHGGTWDPINRKVKWFFTEPGQVYSRILTYTVNTSGRVAAGAVNFGTGDIAITGERVFDGEVSPALLHPADANANWSVSLEEAASLVGQWKLGVSEQPHNVVVRGITLYLQGEQYYWDSEEASPAKRWKSLLSGVLPAMASMPSANEGDLRVTAAVALPVEGAVRRISSGVVSVYVTPPGGTFAWGCEESVPSGVAVSGIGSAGVWDPVSHKIRWAFFDGQPRDLVYTVSGEPGQYTLSGRIGFDGSEEDVQGETSVIVPRPFAAWAAARGLSSDLQEAFSQTDPTTGVPNGWRYVFGDAFQPGAELLHITMVGGIPVVDMPAQDVTTLDDVDLRLEATTYLDASVWDLAVEPVSGGEAGRSYWMPLVVPYRAFFRFKATLK